MSNQNSHNSLDQLLHDFYLGNPSIAELSFELESMLSSKRMPSCENIFITGLARSGTTSVFNYIHASDEFASLLYSDMPFLLMPNLWSKMTRGKKSEKKERFHGDNILIGNDSPEALDEFFWKVFLKNAYIKNDHLCINDISDDIKSKYEEYISLVCKARKRGRYLSKNNNSILRLSTLLKLKSSTKVIMLYRNPFDQAASLLKLHQRFSVLQNQDDFILRYFNYIGHHEFGLNQKPFRLMNDNEPDELAQQKDSIEFWLQTWINYYAHILKFFSNEVIFISFEDVCLNPEKTYGFLKNILHIENPQEMPKQYISPVYSADHDTSSERHDRAIQLLQELDKKRAYI